MNGAAQTRSARKKLSFRPERRRKGGRSGVEKPLAFLRAGEGGAELLRGEEKFEICPPCLPLGLSRGLGSPLCSARWPAFAPVEMTAFFGRFARRRSVAFFP